MTALRSENSDLILFYLRISLDRERNDLAVQRQLAEGKKIAKQIGAMRTLEFEDPDISASSGKRRPGFEAMLDKISSGEVDGATVYAWAQDRLTRRGPEFERMLALFEVHNIRLVCPGDGTDIRPSLDGALIARIRAAVAQEETRKMKARLLVQRAQMRTAGRRHGKLPFGWNRDGSVHPVQGPLVQEAVRRYLAGEGWLAIARDWAARTDVPKMSYVKRHENGVRLPAEQQATITREWIGEDIRRLASRPANAGILTHKGTRLDVAGDWTPLISEDELLAVTNRARRRTVRPDIARHLLGGVLRCHCSNPMYGIRGRKAVRVRGGKTEVREYPIYRCGRIIERQRGAACSQQINMALVDEAVCAYVIEQLKRLKPADLVSKDKAARLAALDVTIAALSERASGARRLFGKGVLDEAGLEETLGEIAPDKARAEAERAMLLAETGRAKVLTQLIGPGASEAFGRASDEIKRAAISELVQVTIGPGDAWHTPITERVMFKPLV